MRADAKRNRDRLLTAADEVFAEEGATASTEEVARRAGVGIGTVFRHFPTKESLVEAVLVARLRRLADIATELTEWDEPEEAFFTFLDNVVDQSMGKKAFSDALAEMGVDVDEVSAPAKDDLRNAGERLLARAQQAGAVRMDISVPELMGVLVGITRAAEYTNHDLRLRDRTIRVIIDGLRTR